MALHSFNRIWICGGIIVYLDLLVWPWNISHDMIIAYLRVSFSGHFRPLCMHNCVVAVILTEKIQYVLVCVHLYMCVCVVCAFMYLVEPQ